MPEGSVTGDIDAVACRPQDSSVRLVSVSGKVDDLVVRLPRAELDDIVSYSVGAHALLQKKSLFLGASITHAHRALLQSAAKLSARTKCEFYRIGNAIVTCDVDVQLEASRLFHHRNLLVQHLHIAHLPVWEIQLAPETAVLDRC